MKRLLVVALVVLMAFSTLTMMDSTADESGEFVFKEFRSAYDDVNWSSVERKHGALHTHSLLSDGSNKPERMIDEAHDLGYDILAFSEHDNDLYGTGRGIPFPWNFSDQGYSMIWDLDVYDGIIYTAGGDMRVVAYDMDNDTEIWDHTEDFETGFPQEIMSVDVVDDYLYMASRYNVTCFDRHTGEKIWSHDPNVYINSEGAIIDNEIYIIDYHNVVRLNKSDGSVIQDEHFGETWRKVETCGEHLYIATHSVLRRIERNLTTITETEFESRLGTLRAGVDNLYLFHARTNYMVLNKTTLEVKYQLPLNYEYPQGEYRLRFPRDVYEHDSKLYIISNTGYTYCADIETGEYLWHHYLNGINSHAVTVHDGVLYTGDLENKVVAYNLTDGNHTIFKDLHEPGFENRCPEEMGMVTFRGVEYSRPSDYGAHINGYYTEFVSGHGIHDFEYIVEQASKDGFLILHEHGHGYSLDWMLENVYVHDEVTGYEIFNKATYDNREIYDELIHHLGHDRMVHAHAQCDAHGWQSMGSNRDIYLVEDFEPGYSCENVRNAIESGHSYFWRSTGLGEEWERGTKPSVNITGIKNDGENIVFEFDGEVGNITWESWDSTANETVTVATGNNLSYTDIDYEKYNFVRAEIENPGSGLLFTQPFYIVTEFFGENNVSVETKEAVEITHNSAILQGELTQIGTEEVDVYFRYRKYGEEYWQSTEKQTLENPDIYEQEIEDLYEDMYYEYKAVAEWEKDDYLYETKGDVLIFKTLYIHRPPPSLSITRPEDSIENLTYEENLTIEGITDPDANIEVDGQQVQVDAETGYFEKRVELDEGLNVIEVVARDEHDNTAVEKVYALYLPEIPEIWEEIESILKTVGSLEEEIQDLENDLKELETEYDIKLEELDGRLNELENNLDENVTILQDSLNRLDDLEEHHEELQKEISEVESNITEIKNNIVDVESDISELKEEYSENGDEETDPLLLRLSIILNLVVLFFLVLILILYFYPKLKKKQEPNENDDVEEDLDEGSMDDIEED